MTWQDGSDIQSKLFELPDKSSFVYRWRAPGPKISRKPVGYIDNSLRWHKRHYHFVDVRAGHIEKIQSDYAVTEPAPAGNNLDSW